ncbi:MAG: hypothetical protein QOH72_5139 [Solirubrobacteraceae bacterium]|nr:hypothetical protein [Solirubrobacteraceae bacterium]
MPAAEPHEDDDFPPRRPFGVPSRPALPDPNEDDDGATPDGPGRAGAGASRCQPPATPS